MNDSRTITGLLAGNHSVGLLDVASTCVVSDQNPRTINVPAGGASQTNFAITCTAPANQPPTANFTPNCNGLDCSFTSTSSDPDGTITSQQWNFGDGTTGSGASPSHHYNAANTYQVTLTVRDNGGLTDVLSKDVVVSQPPVFDQPPIVDAGSEESVLLALSYPLKGASFTDPDHDGPWTVSINWGDGSSPSTFPMGTEGSISRSHTYVLGTFTIRVTVTDFHGNSAFAEKVLHVLQIL